MPPVPLTDTPPVLFAPTLWFVGLTTLDVIHRGLAPAHRNQKVTANWQSVSAGGPAANAAVVAAALGARSVLLTALGDSPAAQVARADLEAHGVQVVDFADAAFQFPVSAILVDELTSERSVVSLDGGSWGTQQLAPIDFAALASKANVPTDPVAERSNQAPRNSETRGGPDDGIPAWVLFDGHHPNLARQVADWISAQQSRKPKVILDGGRWRPIFADLIPIAEVAALSADFQIPDAQSSLGMGAKAVVVTHGPAPVAWEIAGQRGTVRVP